MVDRARRDDEPLGDLGVAEPVGEQAEDVELARRETRRVLARRPCAARARARGRRARAGGASRVAAPGARRARCSSSCARRRSASSPVSASASAASYGRPRRVHSAAASSQAPARPSANGPSASGRELDVETGEAPPVRQLCRSPPCRPALDRRARRRGGRGVDRRRAVARARRSPPALPPGRRSRSTSSGGTSRRSASSSGTRASGSPRRARTSASTRSACDVRPGRVSRDPRARASRRPPRRSSDPVRARRTRSAREDVDPPEIEVVRLAVLERRRQVRRRARSWPAEPAAADARAVERARDLLRSLPWRRALGDDALERSLARCRNRPRAQASRAVTRRLRDGRPRRRSAPRLRSPRAPGRSSSAASSSREPRAVRAAPRRAPRSRAGRRPARAASATASCASVYEAAAEEVRAQLRERSRLLRGCALRPAALDRLADHRDRLDLVVGEVARPRASLEQRRPLAGREAAGEAQRPRVLRGRLAVRTRPRLRAPPRRARTRAPPRRRPPPRRGARAGAWSSSPAGRSARAARIRRCKATPTGRRHRVLDGDPGELVPERRRPVVDRARARWRGSRRGGRRRRPTTASSEPRLGAGRRERDRLEDARARRGRDPPLARGRRRGRSAGPSVPPDASTSVDEERVAARPCGTARPDRPRARARAVRLPSAESGSRRSASDRRRGREIAEEDAHRMCSARARRRGTSRRRGRGASRPVRASRRSTSSVASSAQCRSSSTRTVGVSASTSRERGEHVGRRRAEPHERRRARRAPSATSSSGPSGRGVESASHAPASTRVSRIERRRRTRGRAWSCRRRPRRATRSTLPLPERARRRAPRTASASASSRSSSTSARARVSKARPIVR